VLIQRPEGFDQRGMFSMAFAPDYARSGRFYVAYIARDDMLRLEEVRRSRDPNRANPSTRRLLLAIGPASRFDHGGQVQFGPDRMLYLGTGEMANPVAAQDIGDLRGKILRLDPRPSEGRPYSIPPDNPFRGRSGALPEIYAYGLRNPYRFSFDRRTGALTIGDVGQDEVEEIDFIRGRPGGRQPRGGYNFGWDSFEGRERYEAGAAPGRIGPVLQHTHAAGFCSITGGYVIRDRSLGRGWTGQYIYGDYCDGTLRLSRLLRPASRSHATRMKVSSLVSFGEDSRGRVYAVSLNGPVYRIGRR
jgi:glucose/arabinose dehydrogenase